MPRLGWAGHYDDGKMTFGLDISKKRLVCDWQPLHLSGSDFVTQSALNRTEEMVLVSLEQAESPSIRSFGRPL